MIPKTDQNLTSESASLTPWIGPNHLNEISKYLITHKINMLETGSGGSTLYFLRMMRLGSTLVSIEHKQDWYDKVGDAWLQAQKDYPFQASLQRYLKPHIRDYIVAPFGHAPYDVVFLDGTNDSRMAHLRLGERLLRDTSSIMIVHDVQSGRYDNLFNSLYKTIYRDTDPEFKNKSTELWIGQLRS